MLRHSLPASSPLVGGGASLRHGKSPSSSPTITIGNTLISLSICSKNYEHLWNSFEGSKKKRQSQSQQRLVVLCNSSSSSSDNFSRGRSNQWDENDGDYVEAHVVDTGEFAIGKLIDALHEDEKGGRPNPFQLMRDLVGTLGYEVRMIRITERVVNTYYARIYIGKPEEKAMLSVDARPSDAINLARRCKVPIYVNKAIVTTDAIKLVYGKSQIKGNRRGNSRKSSYDLSLDSAAEGPDLIAEELNLVRNMLIAVVEERYKDAALWRDELNKLRMNSNKDR